MKTTNLAKHHININFWHITEHCKTDSWLGCCYNIWGNGKCQDSAHLFHDLSHTAHILTSTIKSDRVAELHSVLQPVTQALYWCSLSQHRKPFVRKKCVLVRMWFVSIPVSSFELMFLQQSDVFIRYSSVFIKFLLSHAGCQEVYVVSQKSIAFFRRIIRYLVQCTWSKLH